MKLSRIVGRVFFNHFVRGRFPKDFSFIFHYHLLDSGDGVMFVVVSISRALFLFVVFIYLTEISLKKENGKMWW